jgi:hypothetical protein
MVKVLCTFVSPLSFTIETYNIIRGLLHRRKAVGKKAEFRKGSGHIKVLADPLVESTPFNSYRPTRICDWFIASLDENSAAISERYRNVATA